MIWQRLDRPLDSLAVAISTGFGIGYMPKAPGTWGSVLGIGLGWMLHSSNSLLGHPSWLTQLLALVSLSIFGLWAIARTERLWGVHDSGKIVWDEVVGQAIPVLFVDLAWLPLILVFVSFRLLDIWKPGPIGWADEHLPGALGTFLDDIIAGVATAVGVLAISFLID